ncbi:hypothetical protein T4A_1878 [Trichinella pseudospiralis]|uniref:Uncharacterized protein n=1 Tax=Trichinella pseudospiralis TaxID=6337 RepID=A0A0V1ET08_TRIPS|nr:hypothetical protein T4A_1878 [Trichinella pseudospiralis]
MQLTVAIAAAKNWVPKRMDLHSTFLTTLFIHRSSLEGLVEWYADECAMDDSCFSNGVFYRGDQQPGSTARLADSHIESNAIRCKKWKLLIFKVVYGFLIRRILLGSSILYIPACFSSQHLKRVTLQMNLQQTNTCFRIRMSWMICRCICNRRVRALETGCLRSEPGSAITVSFRESNAVRCDKFVDLQNFLSFTEMMHLIASVFLAIADEFATDEYML